MALPLGALAPAAEAEVLISNLGRSDNGDLTVGTPSSLEFTQALGFRTGAAAGYRITSVRAKFNSASSSSGVRVRIFSASGSNPGSSEYLLENPSSLGSGTLTFAAPQDADLDPNKLYFVVFDATGTSSYSIDITDSDALTGTPSAGWTLNNKRHRKIGTGAWTTQDAKPLIEINGDVIITNAAGQPEITGVPQVGQTLTATIGTITDDNGLPTWPSGFTFQWVRVNGSTETVIGSNAATYSPTSADVGKAIKVKVSYTDNSDIAEGPLESEATDKVAAALGACPSDANWCTTMTVGHVPRSGQVEYLGVFGSTGELEDPTIEYDGSAYSISILAFQDQSPGTNSDELLFSLNAFLPRGTILNLEGAEFTLNSGSEQTGTGTYLWPRSAGFGWIVGQKVRVGVKFPANATGVPEISGVPQVGETLTATLGTIEDDNGVPNFPSAFTFQWVRVDGSTERNIGTDSPTYNPVPADVGKKIKVKVTYTDGIGIAEGPIESAETAKTAAALGPCPSDADWCTTMTVGYVPQSGQVEYLGVFGSTGELEDPTIEYDGSAYSISILAFQDQSPGTNSDELLFSLNAFLPRGTILNLEGAEFTLNSGSEQAGTGTYLWPRSAGFGWIVGQKVRVGIAFPPSAVTIAAVNTEAVYGQDDLQFQVSRTDDTHRALDVTVDLTQSRTYLKETALSQTVHLPSGATSATLTIPASEYGELDDGVWTVRPSKIKATIKKGAGYAAGSPASAEVEMGIAMTVGFGPFTSSFRVDEGSGSVDVTFYATSGEGMGAPTQRVEVRYSTADGTATEPGDYEDTSGSFFFEPEDFVCSPGGYDGCDLARDDHVATKTVTLPIIEEDTLVEGNETFRLLLQKGASNGPEVVYVDDHAIRGVSCTPGSTCTARVTIVDNDGLSQPTENPDWTLTGSTRVFSGTSSAHRRPLMSGTETDTRCLNGSSPFVLTDHEGNPVTTNPEEISYSLHVGKGYAGYPGIVQRFAVPGMFTIDDTGQIRTIVGVDYPNTEGPGGDLRTIYANVRATHIPSLRYAEFRQGFIIIHPTSTHFDDRNPQCEALAQGLYPLTAELVGMPGNHDGTAFTFRIDFSDDVDITPEDMRDHALQVTGATVTSAARVDSRDDLWELTLTPTGTDAVSIIIEANRDCATQGAICASNGRQLTTGFVQLLSYVAPVPTPQLPTLSIEDAEVQEAPGARLVFTITLSEASDETVSFDATTSDGSAIAGEDYVAKDISRTMAAGTTSRVIKIKVLDDLQDEGDETMTVTISNVVGATIADGVATGTIRNSDPMPRAASIRTAREIGGQLVEAVSARADGDTGTHVTVGGVSLAGGGTLEEPDATRPLGLPEWDARRKLDAATRTLTREQLLNDSAFSVSSGSAVAGGPTFAAWGHVASTRFDAEEDEITLDGRVTTGLLGGEVERERLLAGIIVSHSRGDGGFKGEHDIVGEYETSLTGLYPYARADLNERVSAWVLAGGGAGEFTLRSEGHTALETDMSMRVGAAGMRGRVLEPADPGGLGVNLRGDAMWVRAKTDRVNGLVATEADATRLRAIVEAERAYETGTGATVTPTGQVGIRLDGGDAETGAGLELGAGVRYSSGPLTLEGQVRGLVAHEESGYKEWGASAAMRVEPRQGGRGLRLSVAPVWGEAASGAEHLWSARDARELDPARAFEPEGRLEAEVGYGLLVPHTRGLVTPYAGLTLAGEGARTIRTGTRWDLAPGAALGLEGTRTADDSRAVEVRLQVAW